MEQIHATCIDVDGFGVLLSGPPGAGKSDLALRLIDTDPRNRLVADDRTELAARGGALVASPPDALAGKIEVRGIGIADMEYLPETTVRLAVELVARDAVERLPEPAEAEWLGIVVPLIRLHGFDASAPAKVRLAARRAGERHGGAV
jgi:serine kinase of HPr protein (carbohydrate metabolism regulator)